MGNIVINTDDIDKLPENDVPRNLQISYIDVDSDGWILHILRYFQNMGFMGTSIAHLLLDQFKTDEGDECANAYICKIYTGLLKSTKNCKDLLPINAIIWKIKRRE